jgi:GNAT superfamily N-acetyltransferase
VPSSSPFAGKANPDSFPSMVATLPIRVATMDDAPRLRSLIALSVRELQKADYTPEQLAVAVETVFTLDTQLVTDGTYFVIETQSEPGPSDLIACGGWSRRQTLCGGDHHALRNDAYLDPHTDAARIRAFFIHPSWARRGLGSRLLAHCEQVAEAAGFTRFEMAATLTGAPLYKARGYQVVEETTVPLRESMRLPVVMMARKLEPANS